MNDDETLRLRREFRAAVFRTARLRQAGRTVEADEQLAGELAAAHAQCTTAGLPDAPDMIRQWRYEDEATFALAALVAELVAAAGQAAPPTVAPGPAAVRPAPAPAPLLAFPPPPAGLPGLADLLDDMLAQERRPRPPP